MSKYSFIASDRMNKLQAVKLFAQGETRPWSFVKHGEYVMVQPWGRARFWKLFSFAWNCAIVEVHSGNHGGVGAGGLDGYVRVIQYNKWTAGGLDL